MLDTASERAQQALERKRDCDTRCCTRVRSHAKKNSILLSTIFFFCHARKIETFKECVKVKKAGRRKTWYFFELKAYSCTVILLTYWLVVSLTRKGIRFSITVFSITVTFQLVLLFFARMRQFGSISLKTPTCLRLFVMWISLSSAQISIAQYVC